MGVVEGGGAGVGWRSGVEAAAAFQHRSVCVHVKTVLELNYACGGTVFLGMWLQHD